MRAAVLTRPGTLEVREVEDPSCRDDELVVEVAACGICGTDRSIFRNEVPGRTPMVLGHELSGTVVTLGRSVVGFSLGDKVAVDPNVVDGTCFFCRRGESHLCSGLTPIGIERFGGFAERCALPSAYAYRLPESLPIEAGALVEPLACCVRGIDQARVVAGDVVVVLGAGPIGCLLIQLARLSGAGMICCVEPDETRRGCARGAGAEEVCAPDDATALLARVRPGIGADVVIEASGQPAAAGAALGLVRRGGTLVLFGVYPAQANVALSPYRVNEDELRIVGSFNNPHTHQRAIDLLASGRVAVEGIVSHRLGLTGLEKAMDLAHFPGAGKITIDPRAD